MKVTPEMAKRFAVEYRDRPARRIAERYGVDVQTVLRHLRKQGVAIQRGNRGNNRKKPVGIEDHYMTATDAANALGISRFTVNDYLHNGVFPGAVKIGEARSFWLVPRAEVMDRKNRLSRKPEEEGLS